MESKKRKNVLLNILDLSNEISERLANSGQEIEDIAYYEEFEFKGSGLAENDIYIVKLKESKDAKSRDNEDQLEKHKYEIYDRENNLIATVDESGKIEFEAEFAENLKNISEEHYNELTLEDTDFELSKVLQDTDLDLTKDEIEKEKANKKLEDISHATGIKSIEAYSEIDTDKTPQFEKITNKQELDANVMVTQTETLADMIPEIKEKGIVKIGVVYSEQLKGQNGRFSFIGIDKDGQIKTIDSLENVEGTTTGQTVTSINSIDGSIVEKEQVAGMVRINGRSTANGEEEMLSIKQGQYGILEVDYVRADLSKDEKERYFSAPIETSNIYPTTREVRDFMDKSKNTEIHGEIMRANGEIKRDGKTEMINIDDTASNDFLTPDDIIVLQDGSKTTLRNEAKKAKVSPEEFTKKYNSRAGKTPNEKIDSIHEEIEEEYGDQQNAREHI